jgi:hypothetical protein
MTELLQILPRSVKVGVTLLAIWGCSGCRLQGGDSVAHLKGRWTGRVVPVTVFDDFGGEYEVAALEIERGSEKISSRHKRIAPIGLESGSGQLPLLLEHHDGVPTVIPAARLPVGRRVEVRGLMAKYAAMTPRGLQPPRTTRVSRIRPNPPKEPTGIEHVLVVTGRVNAAE